MYLISYCEWQLTGRVVIVILVTVAIFLLSCEVMIMSDKYTVSIRIEKISVAQGMDYVKHLARGADNSFETHSNAQIDPARTQNNKTWLNHADTSDGWRTERVADCNEIKEQWKKRLDTVQSNRTKEGKLKNNAIHALNIVCQCGSVEQPLPPDFPQGKFNRACLDFITEKLFMGKAENIISFSIHYDESTPHIDVLGVPITPDGRLSAKECMLQGHKNQVEFLRQFQADFKSFTADYMAQYGIEIDTAKKEPHRKHMSIDDYKEYKDTQKANAEVLEQSKANIILNEQQQAEIAEREKSLHDREREFETQKEDYERKYKAKTAEVETLTDKVRKIILAVAEKNGELAKILAHMRVLAHLLTAREKEEVKQAETAMSKSSEAVTDALNLFDSDYEDEYEFEKSEPQMSM